MTDEVGGVRMRIGARLPRRAYALVRVQPFLGSFTKESSRSEAPAQVCSAANGCLQGLRDATAGSGQKRHLDTLPAASGPPR
jgi:hypothetical protein